MLKISGVPPKMPQTTAFQRGIIFVRRKHHERFRSVFFFISSYGVGLLFTYIVSDFVSATKRFALKITLKF